MNKEEYLKELQQRLKKLPKEDFDMAMEYFYEYFEEAGEENEQTAIEDLGTPKQAAQQIIMNMAVRNTEEAPEKNVKSNISAIWVGVLAVFAAPIALPLALAAVLVVGSLGISVLAVAASLLVAEAALVGAGALEVLLSVVKFFASPANAAASAGLGLISMGFGILLLPGSVILIKKCFYGFIGIFGKIVRRFAKGGKKHEKKK